MDMRKLLFIFLVLLLVVASSTVSVAKRARQMSAVDDDVYNTLFKLCKGEWNVPLRERTTKQKLCCIRFWRNRLRFSIENMNGEEKLLFDGKVVVKKSNFKTLVETEYKRFKGLGSRKLKTVLNKRFQGVSEAKVQQVLSKSTMNQKMNVRFKNKAILRPIRASAVQVNIIVYKRF